MALVPSFVAFAVTQLLEGHFGRLVDYDFTARMEDDLDRIAAGDEARVEWLRRFRGDGAPGLHALVTEHLDEIDARAVNSIEIERDRIVLRVGRYGPYLERDGERAGVPDDLAPDELTVEKRGRRARRRPFARQSRGRRRCRQDGPLRPIRDRGRAGGGAGPDGVALRLDVAGDGHPRGRAAPPDPPARARRTARKSSSPNGRYGPFVKKTARRARSARGAAPDDHGRALDVLSGRRSAAAAAREAAAA